ncbi:2-C-methyl-D-erythritol 4-phosphate cytidylyltransferase [Alkaliphilus peptidifermentans]|uniref:2-C-methyl-D-erythritol 4-phosphate cytidylyltransferase n=1 Tax=Alkaliphilus peptidifermentans DSM 18978 TaxID=1120976 RepID=A0A1G5KZM0_9FIRM|nr:2-C-methyl-D-erythritol 4-phosphate cytidylyltransferase [Alkaliphilus peptidifermentans]SCZ05611.1 2-C-methyl-D-erythritol 4-phosphate cytidylyltransferase [Alkaliphilus peptidifermentans DSM 18978]
MKHLKNYAIVVAAGKGRRVGREINKQYIKINNKPIVAYTLEVLQKSISIDGIILVVGKGEIDYCREKIVNKYDLAKVISIIEGGKERVNSVANGIAKLPKDCSIVIIQDGARPFLSEEMIEMTITGAEEVGGAIVAVPVKDTIKVVNSNMEVEKTVDRSKLWSIQTPQAFKASLIKEIYQTLSEADKEITDDAMLFERAGYTVKIIMGSYRNIKITTPEDLFVAEEMIKKEKGESNV